MPNYAYYEAENCSPYISSSGPQLLRLSGPIPPAVIDGRSFIQRRSRRDLSEKYHIYCRIIVSSRNMISDTWYTHESGVPGNKLRRRTTRAPLLARHTPNRQHDFSDTAKSGIRWTRPDHSCLLYQEFKVWKDRHKGTCLVCHLPQPSLPHPQKHPLRQQRHQLLVVVLPRQQHHVGSPLDQARHATVVDRDTDGFQDRFCPDSAVPTDQAGCVKQPTVPTKTSFYINMISFNRVRHGLQSTRPENCIANSTRLSRAT